MFVKKVCRVRNFSVIVLGNMIFIIWNNFIPRNHGFTLSGSSESCDCFVMKSEKGFNHDIEITRLYEVNMDYYPYFIEAVID